ncbi:MAG: ribonuclease D [Anaerolineaceae bacterium]|nr:ribonuclease D [Anaerolineaceae bacterium]
MNVELDPKTVHIVNDTDLLKECIDTLRNSTEIAVDTESDSLFVYYEKVCLIQISADGQSYVIDPLETGDLSGLNDIFSNPQILKIFHAAEYDLMCLKRDFGFSFVNLFDTMIAARMLGKNEVGLGPLLENEFGIHLDKRYQKANWGIRPLSQEMLQYAVSDTRFLKMLKEKLESELIINGLEDMAAEDFDRLCKIHAAPSEPHEPVWWRVNGGVELTLPEQGALQGLCEFREKEAQIRDLPPFKILSNSALVNIVLENPSNEGTLRRLKGVGNAVVRRYGKTILEINKNWRRKKRIPQPVLQSRPANGILSRKERLKMWRKNMGMEMNVPSDVILPRDILETIAEVGPRNKSELETLMKEIPARYSRFGEKILEVSLNDSDSDCLED